MSSANELLNYGVQVCALQRCESALPAGLKHARAVMADSPFPMVHGRVLFFFFRNFESRQFKPISISPSNDVNTCFMSPLNFVTIVNASSLFSFQFFFCLSSPIGMGILFVQRIFAASH